MVTYEYRCGVCGLDFDRTFPMGAAPRDVGCPHEWDMEHMAKVRARYHEFALRDGTARLVISTSAVKVEGGTNAGYVKR